MRTNITKKAGQLLAETRTLKHWYLSRLEDGRVPRTKANLENLRNVRNLEQQLLDLLGRHLLK